LLGRNTPSPARKATEVRITSRSLVKGKKRGGDKEKGGSQARSEMKDGEWGRDGKETESKSG